jgi:hypothetical protein
VNHRNMNSQNLCFDLKYIICLYVENMVENYDREKIYMLEKYYDRKILCSKNIYALNLIHGGISR